MSKFIFGLIMVVYLSFVVWAFFYDKNKVIQTVIVAQPKFKVGDCVAWYPNGHYFTAEERWQKSQELGAIVSHKIKEVGKKRYLVDTQYSDNSPNPFHPNESEWISEVDERYEQIDCRDMKKVVNWKFDGLYKYE